MALEPRITAITRSWPPAVSSPSERTASWSRSAISASIQERDSFFLQITEAAVKAVPLMPDHDYQWHSDEEWLSLNDAHFE
jgi:hypothetical protein